MTSHPLPLGETRQFSPVFLDYLQNEPALAPFFGRFPTLENFEAQIEARAAAPVHRDVLYQLLTRQYASVANHPDLSVLKESNTFTVTTGHQLNIFTGPLYVIYKLITTINLAKALRVRYPQYRFVPVYWMATEDHDLAEINHFYLFGKKYEWQTPQTGAVGRMTTQDLTPLLQELPEKVSLFENAYLHHRTLAEATRCVANELFGHEGLVCVDADDRELKALFKGVMRDDLTRHSAFERVKKSSQQLEALGYKTQVNAREVNFFYLDDHQRERIVQEDGGYKVLNTPLSFSEAELLDLVENEPQKFSPNVILRPLYQETVLPNLAYVGGPAEVAYWMQLKDLFAHYQLPYPVVMPRNFALVINKAHAKRIQKLNLSDAALFLDEASLKRRFLEKNTEAVGLEAETAAFDQVFSQVLKKAVALDRSLEGLVLAEKQKLLKSVENIDKRLRKAQEGSQETEINQLMGLKAKLFPNGGLQERTDNYLNFALNNPDFLRQVQAVFDPFSFQFHLLTEE
ncbi:MAG: bacillithiol biosynthesis cysteine-adding enzyme BshC [Ferruginibacter sp.]|nr:bacillithiol biosynthesis cysteine-adding enzyme BshC [Cytophagales bacterium]